MYVCVCKAVTDAAIEKAAENGATSIRDLKRELGLGSGCGKCVLQALQTLKATQGEATPANVIEQPANAEVVEVDRPRLRSALYG